MPLELLGPRQATAKTDTSNFNEGNWTATFTVAVLAVNVPLFEIYKIVVKGAAAGTSCEVMIGNKPFSIGPVGKGAEWDPVQPALVQPGQDVLVLFSQPVTVTPAPQVTLWLRYDTAGAKS